MKLRNEVSLQSELSIKQIQDLSENLINQINDYELDCIVKYEKEEIPKEEQIIPGSANNLETGLATIKTIDTIKSVSLKSNRICATQRFSYSKRELRNPPGPFSDKILLICSFLAQIFLIIARRRIV